VLVLWKRSYCGMEDSNSVAMNGTYRSGRSMAGEAHYANVRIAITGVYRTYKNNLSSALVSVSDSALFGISRSLGDDLIIHHRAGIGIDKFGCGVLANDVGSGGAGCGEQRRPVLQSMCVAGDEVNHVFFQQ